MRNAISTKDLSHFDIAAAQGGQVGARINSCQSLNSALAVQGSLMQAIATIYPKAHPVRVVAFNKTQETNWGVPWHQDRVIAVAEKCDVLGFDNWTEKRGVWHCEPPHPILDQMLFVRVHLDDTDHNNGAMEIAVGSHAQGVVPSANAEKTANRFPIESCDAKRGDVLILKMLTLHRSKPSMATSNRRAFRIDFATEGLPAPLNWRSVTPDLT
ncbi:MAG: phytanoyl-CoA dioxygenase family protein [Paracoccaceae bacterium]